MMKTLLIFATLTVSMTSVGYAQSYDPDFGSGNVLWNNQRAILQQKAAIKRSGLDAFATVPNGPVGNRSDLPENTGGGSLGYNEKLKVY